MWITCFLFLAASQGIVQGYEYIGDSVDEMYRDLDNWRHKSHNNGHFHQRLNSQPAKKPASPTVSAAHYALKAAKVAVEVNAVYKQIKILVGKAAMLNKQAAIYAKLAAHEAEKAATRSAAHISKIPGTSASSGSSAAAAAAAAAAAGKAAAKAVAKAGGSPAQAALAKKAAAAAAAKAAAAGKKPGSAAGSAAGGAKKPGSSAGGAKPTSSRPQPTGTSGPSGSSGSCGAKSFMIELRFATLKFADYYQNMQHKESRRLEFAVCQQVRKVYASKGGLCNCDVVAFRKGSVLALMQLKFTKAAKDPLQKIKDALKKKAIKVGTHVADSKPNSVFAVKGVGSTACKPCNTKLAPGVKMVKQGSCPTGYCATLMLNPSQIMQAAAPVQQPAPATSYSYAPQPAQSMYGTTSCHPMCQPRPPQYSCNPQCPPTCCRSG